MTADEENFIRSPESLKEESTTPTTTTPTTPTTTPPTAIAVMSQNAPDKGSLLSKKRSATTVEPNGTAKVTKRRAARACVSCRNRKVRCDVVEGAPCGNCRWDNIPCVVQESRRRKKGLFEQNSSTTSHMANVCAPQHQHTEAQLLKAKSTPSPIAIASAAPIAPLHHHSEFSQTSIANNDANYSGVSSYGSVAGHVPPHLYCTDSQRSGLSADPVLLPALQASNQETAYPGLWPQIDSDSNPSSAVSAGVEALERAQFLNSLDEIDISTQQPGFLRPLPEKIAPEDVAYLRAKGALSVPGFSLQSALLHAYVEYVYPYMPLLDLHDFLGIIDARDGSRGQTSLFLYQAVMFCATAFVSSKILKEAGYASRKAARRAFFTKARLLYDFDYENDRLLLVQGLLLMTYWYETPDDQKDTWHWMGVAISLGHTIGLHRNPANTNMSPQKQKLWKRIWWSCFMRDRLVALGMRRPTRIKDEDFDVPMLEEGDFEFNVLPDEVQVVGPECTLLRDVAMQQELAQMCVAKAKLSLCISYVLKAQYSVLDCTKTPENTTNSTMMLLPNKQLDNMGSIVHCDSELAGWAEALPESCKYRPLSPGDDQNGRAVIAVQRNLLHMVYYTTVSALYRPLFLPSSSKAFRQASSQVQQVSRERVCTSAIQITQMVAELYTMRLDRYLPTTGVTVLLPAMIIHMIEIKHPSPKIRVAHHGYFQECMRVMERLRDIYTAADYAVAFVRAAMQKGAQVAQTPQTQAFNNENNKPTRMDDAKVMMPQYSTTMPTVTTPPPESMLYPSVKNAPVLRSDPTLSSDVTQLFEPSSDMMSSTSTAARSSTDINNSLTNINVGTPAPVPCAVLNAHSPPPTDVMTPKSSATSSGSPSSVAHQSIDINYMDFDNHQPEEFDWNTLAGPNLDFDMFLEFPPSEGPAPGPGLGPELGL
ncbi:fungal-specific transcription factor domain-containing protein [Xylariaceae sp. AK1471]|nr:fungal-specific transcription factor domain-containing protein [Xylariaceae sp. AK1471]